MARLVTLLVAAVLTNSLTATQASDAARVLADMRQALGGDALAGVRGFSVEGAELPGDGGGMDGGVKVEWVCILPDRFIQTRSLKNQFAEFATAIGFAGNQPVLVFKGSVLGMRPPARPAGTPSDEAAASQATVTAAKQQFSRYAIAMFGITPAYPLDVADVAQQTVDGKSVHVVQLTAPDGYRLRLHVDTKTNLPWMISWLGPAPLELLGARPDQAADLPVVEHRIFFSDYKKADGLNWPHRLREVVARTTVVDTRLGKFKINPPIDTSRFASSR